MRGELGSGEHIGFRENMRHGVIPGIAIVLVGTGNGDAEAVGAIVGEAVGTGPMLDGLGDGGTGVGDAGDADGTEPVVVAVGAADGPGDGCDLAQDETTSDAPLNISSATRIERKLFTCRILPIGPSVACALQLAHSKQN